MQDDNIIKPKSIIDLVDIIFRMHELSPNISDEQLYKLESNRESIIMTIFDRVNHSRYKIRIVNNPKRNSYYTGNRDGSWSLSSREDIMNLIDAYLGG